MKAEHRGAGDGGGEAAGPLFAQCQEELRRVARSHMYRQRSSHTLQTTALINETYLKLVRGDSTWNSRGHFIATASRAMRSILVDHARGKGRRKRSSGGSQLPMDMLDSLVVTFGSANVTVLDFDDGLSQLEADGDRGAQAVRVCELHLIGGLNMREVSEATGVPLRTTERLWAFARSWLQDFLGD